MSVVESPPVAWSARGCTAGGVTLELVAFMPPHVVPPSSGSLGGQLRLGHVEHAIWDGRIFGLLDEGRRNVTFSTRVFVAGESQFADLLVARGHERAPTAIQRGAALQASFYPPLTAVSIARLHQGLRDLRRQGLSPVVLQKSARQVANEVGRLGREQGHVARLSVERCADWIADASTRTERTHGLGEQTGPKTGMRP